MMKLLIVDDSRVIWERMSMLQGVIPGLESIVYTTSLQEASTQLVGDMPDWVVLDVNLPDGNGLDLLRRIKSLNHPVKVAIFTNHPEYRQHSLDLGADSFFDKSMDFQDLLDMLRQEAQLDANSHKGDM